MKLTLTTRPNGDDSDIIVTDEQGNVIEGIDSVYVTIVGGKFACAQVVFESMHVDRIETLADFDRGQIKRMAEAVGYEVKNREPGEGGDWDHTAGGQYRLSS